MESVFLRKESLKYVLMLCSAAMLAETSGASREIVLPPGMNCLETTYLVSEVGTEKSPLIIRSADPERPAILSGGRRITGWKVGPDGVWRVTLPEVKAGEWNFVQLFVNGKRRFRPAIPHEGFLTSLSNACEDAKSVGGLWVTPGDVKSSWANRGDIELQAFHNWSVTRMYIDTIDEKSGLVTFPVPRAVNVRQNNFKKRRYRLENVKEAFGRPGEWYLDRPSGVLSYMPCPGENPHTAEVVAPYLDKVVCVTNAKHVIFKDVIFAHQSRVTPREGCYAIQAAFNLPPSVQVVDSEHITFERCGFYHVGGYALDFGRRSRACAVKGCVMRDLGGGGVTIGPFGKDPPDGRGKITIEDCRITEGGRIVPAAVGILIGRSSYNRIVHNEVDHLYYTGISVGWNWDSKPSQAHHNEIAFNHVHDIGQGVLSDMGLVYLLGRAPGTTVHDNFLHDILTGEYGGNGVYADEGSSELKVYNNVIMNTRRSYHQNHGEDNEVFNNVFINSESMQYSFRPHPMTKGNTVSLHHNVCVWKKGGCMDKRPPFSSVKRKLKNWTPPPFEAGCQTASNLYWCVGEGEFKFGKLSFDEWKSLGRDVGSLAADPLFVGDVWRGEVEMKAASPAFEMGIRPLDPCKAGVRTARARPVPQWPCPTPFSWIKKSPPSRIR